MKKFLCIRDCQYQPEEKGSKIRFVNHGVVIEALKNPKTSCFESLEGDDHKVDFTTAGEAELLDAKWTVKEAQAAIKEAYGVSIKSGPKKDVVDQIIDARYRQVD